MQSATPAAPGWYADPNGLPCQRWWDGNTWLDQTAPQTAGQATDLGDRGSGAHRRPGSSRTRTWIGIGIAAAAVVAGVVTVVVVMSGGNSHGGSASSSDARAESELRNGVLAIEQCYADSGQYPASVTAAGKDGPLVLDCNGQTQTVQLSAYDVASVASTGDAYVIEVASVRGTQIYSYDSKSGVVTHRPRK